MYGSERISPSRSAQPTSLLSFQRILDRVKDLRDETIYIVLEFDHRGDMYASREMSGSKIKANPRMLFWHATHTYNILEKDALRSPLSVGIGHQVPDRVEKILH